MAVVAATGYVAWGRLHQGPDAAKYGLREVRFELHSKLLDRTVTEVGVMPPPLPDGRPRPLLVFLHGRGGSAVAQATDGLLKAIRDAGDRAPDVVFADGGDASYYHDRATGQWGSYVVKEVIPEAVRRLHADPRRVAIAGISMGGFGALDIARLWPGRFCAAAGHSAAMWRTGGETPEGAFDNAEDFARHDLMGAVAGHDPYGQMRISGRRGHRRPVSRGRRGVRPITAGLRRPRHVPRVARGPRQRVLERPPRTVLRVLRPRVLDVQDQGFCS